jgi:uncharacterized RDD family membrane protein YckC
MNTQLLKSMVWALAVSCVLWTTARAQDTASPPDQEIWHHHNHSNRDDVVSVGRGAELAAGHHAESVVAVFGSAVSAGDVDDTVVSVMGHTRITGGRVGNAAVAVMGSVYVNGEVDGDVVAVLGNVELGPEARVRGNVVIVGGDLRKDPAASIDGQVQTIVNFDWSSFEWLHSWVDRCLLYGRPLAFSEGLQWAWGIALGLLALYAFVAFLMRGAVEQCIHTLEAKPGQSLLAALLTVLLTPVLFILLLITIVGIAAIPFLFVGLLLVAMFGKIIVLAYIGRRCTPMLARDPATHTVVGVIVGGAIALMIYTIPLVGFMAYKLMEILGFGVVVYTLLLAARAGRQARVSPPPMGADAADARAEFGSFEDGEPVGGSSGRAGVADAAGAASGGVGGGSSMGGTSGTVGGGDTTGGAAGGGGGTGGAAGGGGGTADGAAGGGGTSGGAAGGFTGPGGAANFSSTEDTAALLALPRAGFGIRMAALLLDLLLVGIVLHAADHGARLHLLAVAAYGAVMWKLKGSTIGGIICGLRIVRLDRRPVDWPTAIVRALGCFLSCAVAGLGFIWIAIDDGHQAWHDKIAGTVVVRAPKGASLV